MDYATLLCLKLIIKIRKCINQPDTNIFPRPFSQTVVMCFHKPSKVSYFFLNVMCIICVSENEKEIRHFATDSSDWLETNRHS